MTLPVAYLLQNLLADTRMALRQLRRSPLFAFTIVATFALGIGANAAVFSMMDALVLRPLAVPQVDRVVTIAEQRGAEYPSAVSFADYREYAERTHLFEELAARSDSQLTLTRGGQSEHVEANRTTLNLFRAFHIAPLLGRTFMDGEDQPGRDGEAVLTHAFWQSRFGSRRDALGQSLLLDGRPYTVVGIMPQSFDHVVNGDFWLPMALSPEQRSDRKARRCMITGRLRAGVSLPRASEELNAVAAGIARGYPQTNAGWKVRVRPLLQTINGDLTPVFMEIILAATLLLMLVVCANIANLQFARTMRRAPEMAIRSALGSSRPALLRQLLMESLVQSMLGAGAGLLLARVWLHLMVAQMPASVARFLAGWSDVHLNGPALVYSVAVAAAAGLASGLPPALAGMRVDLLGQLKLGGRSVSGARSGRMRNVFAGAQVALATALIAGSACLAASMYTMLHAAGRVAPQQVLLLPAYLPSAHYPSAVSQGAFLHASLDRLRALPGVRSAEFTTALPYNNTGVWWQDLSILGDPAFPGQSRATQRLTVSPGMLQSFGIGLVRGRFLSPGDGMSSPRVAVVSQRLARMYFGDKDPIGHQIQLGKGPDLTAPARVVGVVADVVYTWTDQVAQPAVYLSDLQFPSAAGTYVVRAEGEPLALAPAARQALLRLDSTVPVDPAESYAQFLHESLIGLWYVAVMLAVDAGIALFLCALGIFGVMANIVTERTHEIGIRLAVGADRREVVRLFLRRTVLITGCGLGVGLVLGVGVGRVLTGVLQGVAGLQGTILLAAAVSVACVSILAGYLPARRAAALDPMDALRTE